MQFFNFFVLQELFENATINTFLTLSTVFYEERDNRSVLFKRQSKAGRFFCLSTASKFLRNITKFKR